MTKPVRPPDRVLVTGAQGMLGRDVSMVLEGLGRELTTLGRDGLDITQRDACMDAVVGHDVVVNAAAYTNVDGAEEHESDAWAVNALGAENLAIAAEAHGARLVHVSTDYVFDGTKSAPYNENDPTAPVSAYGRSKAEGERLVRAVHPDGSIIVRSAWLYGAHGSNFVRTIAHLYRERGSLTVVDDQHGQPTWTLDVAKQIALLLDTRYRRGTLHCTNAGNTTWFGFAQAIVENLGGNPADVHPTDSAGFPRAAQRPANSVLGHAGWGAVGLPAMRPWRAALDEAMGSGALD
ncbi:MAG: dTDP-4-dehydrorhamnose reductase [Rhodoglobus sp.]